MVSCRGNKELRDASDAHVQGLKDQLGALQADIAALKVAQEGFVLGLKDCCKNDTDLAALVAAIAKEQVAALMGGAGGGGMGGASGGMGTGDDGDGDASTLAAMGLGAGDADPTSSAFTAWLHSQYASREDIDGKIAAMAAELRQQFKDDAEAKIAAALLVAESEATKTAFVAAAQAVENITNNEKSKVVAAGAGVEAGAGADTVIVGTGCTSCTGLSKAEVDAMIKAEVLKFWADRTGMSDFALESAGGSIMSTRCSETYYRRTAQLSLFGIPLWYASNSPRTVLQVGR